MTSSGYFLERSVPMVSSWLMPWAIHLGTGGRSMSSGKFSARPVASNSSLPVGVESGYFSGSL